MPGRSRSGLFIIFFSLLLAASGTYIFFSSKPYSPRKDQPLGMIVHFTGSPQIRDEGNPFWRKVVLSEPVFDGQKIKTSQMETVIIKTSQNEIIKVSENSTITIQKKQNAPMVKINMGNTDLIQTQNDESAKVEYEKLVEETRLLKEQIKNIKLKTSTKVVNIVVEQDKLAILKPEDKSSIVIQESKDRDIQLSWTGSKGNDFKVEVSINGKPSQKYLTKHLEQTISLNSEATSGVVKWRVHDMTSGQSTPWSQFQYDLGFPPHISEPLNNSHIMISDSSSELFKVVIDSPYSSHELELFYNNQSQFIPFKGSSFTILKSSLSKLESDKSTLLSLRARSEVKPKQWTDWSQVTLINLVQPKQVKISSVKNTNTKMVCENNQWRCLLPVRIKLENITPSLVTYTSQWYLLNNSSIYSTPASFHDDTLVTCPPFPHSDWRLKIVEKNKQTQMSSESPEIKIAANSSSPPTPFTERVYLIQEDEIVLEFSTCPDTLTKSTFEFQNKETESLITNSNSFLTKLNRSNPTSVVTQFLDLNKVPISETSEKFPIKPLYFYPSKPANTKKAQETHLRWTLKDANEIYVAAQNKKAWSPLAWQSTPAFSEYEYQIARDPEFKNIIESNIVKKTSIKTLIPDNVTVIYWRVRGLEGGNVSNWTTTRQVKITQLGKNSKGSRLSLEQSK
jgi:hypothetical protein